jgi:hypothetical protein
VGIIEWRSMQKLYPRFKVAATLPTLMFPGSLQQLMNFSFYRRGNMTTSIIIGVVAIAIIITWTICSRKKERHHLDKLHINPNKED